MRSAVDAVWQDLPADWSAQLAACIARAGADRNGNTAVYFRADDVAVPGPQFRQMTAVFRRQRAPLALAVVPAWLTPARWQALGHITLSSTDLWCWHQHGWRHQNHEPAGKKQEFGPARSDEAIAADLRRGRRRLAAVMGRAFYPAFTPPWNRCSATALALLAEMGYKAVSRSRERQPPVPPGLIDIWVDVDLHTNRVPSAAAGWCELMQQLTAGLSAPRCGIMLHHRRMNAAAGVFLEALLAGLRGQDTVTIVDLREFCAP